MFTLKQQSDGAKWLANVVRDIGGSTEVDRSDGSVKLELRTRSEQRYTLTFDTYYRRLFAGHIDTRMAAVQELSAPLPDFGGWAYAIVNQAIGRLVLPERTRRCVDNPSNLEFWELLCDAVLADGMRVVSTPRGQVVFRGDIGDWITGEAGLFQFWVMGRAARVEYARLNDDETLGFSPRTPIDVKPGPWMSATQIERSIILTALADARARRAT